jgi:hypothetical protein
MCVVKILTTKLPCNGNQMRIVANKSCDVW